MKISTKATMTTAAVSAALTVLLLTGCSGNSPAASPGDTSQGSNSSDSSSVAIVIQNFEFKGPISVSPGATVSVTNLDSQDHSVTSDDGAFDVVVHANKKATFTAPAGKGSYQYHCSFHPNMRGTLVVK